MRPFFLFLALLKDDALSELFRVLLELDFALYFTLILAGVVDLAGFFISEDNELVLGHGISKMM